MCCVAWFLWHWLWLHSACHGLSSVISNAPFWHLLSFWIWLHDNLVNRWNIDLFSCGLKMAHNPQCPNTPKGTKRHGDQGGSTHHNKNISLFKAEVIQVCINEINRVEGEARLNNKKPKKSRNQICEDFGLSPSTVSSDTVPFVSSVGTPALLSLVERPALLSSLVVNLALLPSS